MLYRFYILVLINGLHQSSQSLLLEKRLEEKEAVQETYFRNGTATLTNIRPIRLSPSKYVKVYLFSRETGEEYSQIVFENLTSFENSVFDVNKPTKMLIHGWLASAFGSFENELRETYLSAQDVNVLAVDWSKEADSLYSLARSRVVSVGKFLAQFVDWLVSEADVSLSSIHIIGHSLGAHIAGVVGEHVTVGNISRISGLDPAAPQFFNYSTSGRLDSSDAQFVDVIHTCAPIAGFYDACGHVDFYPNKGEPPQPGCEPPTVLTCSHIRSHDLFNESITSREFVSTRCSDWKVYAKGGCDSNSTTVMGEHVDTSARGKFYLYTGKSYPYALGDQ